MKLQNSSEWASLPIGSIKPYDRQLRRHNSRSMCKLEKLIRQFGQIVPIIVDTNRFIIDGHLLWLVMREMGAGEIATITVTGRTDPEIKALRLALNRLPAEAVWDNKQLRKEFEELLNLSFDLKLTGFDAAEIDHVLDLDPPQTKAAAYEAPIPRLEQTAVTKPGDIWRCGQNRLGCGDPLDGEFIARVREGSLVDVVFTHPLYGATIAAKVPGKDPSRHGEFGQRTDEMPTEQSIEFFTKALQVLKVSCSPEALIYACTNWRHVHELLSAGIRCALELYNICVWAKPDGESGALYRDQHELVCVFRVKTETPATIVKLGRQRRYRSNLWTYRKAFGADRADLSATHSTVKPIALVADVLRDVTKRGGILLDTFIGSGSSLMAAEETGRRCFGTEVDPIYVDVALRRWQARTKCHAIHTTSGESFVERAERLGKESPHAG